MTSVNGRIIIMTPGFAPLIVFRVTEKDRKEKKTCQTPSYSPWYQIFHRCWGINVRCQVENSHSLAHRGIPSVEIFPRFVSHVANRVQQSCSVYSLA